MENILNKQARLRAPLILITLLFCVIFYFVKSTAFSFCDDDYGVFHRALTFSQGPLLYCKQAFSGVNNNDSTITPDGDVQNNSGPLSAYRPLSLIFWGLLASILKALGLVPQAPLVLFLLSLLLHLIILLSLITLFCAYLPHRLAVGCALLWAFFPGWGLSFGRLSIMPYQIYTYFQIISFILVRQFIEEKKTAALLGAALITLEAALLHEQPVFWPIFLSIFSLIQNCRTGIFVAATQSASLAAYAGLRLLAFGLKNGSTGGFSTKSLFKKACMFGHNFFVVRKFDLIKMLTDTFGMFDLSEGNAKLKVFILSFFFVIFLLGFFSLARTGKKLAALFCFGFLSSSWVSILITHQIRYLYSGLWMLLLAQSMCWEKVFGKNNATVLCLIFASYGAITNHKILVTVQNKFSKGTDILKCFIQEAYKNNFNDQDIVLVALPQELLPRSGIKQALEVLSLKYEQKLFGKIYCPKLLCLQTTENNRYDYLPDPSSSGNSEFYNDKLVLQACPTSAFGVWAQKEFMAGLLELGNCGLKLSKVSVKSESQGFDALDVKLQSPLVIVIFKNGQLSRLIAS